MGTKKEGIYRKTETLTQLSLALGLVAGHSGVQHYSSVDSPSKT